MGPIKRIIEMAEETLGHVAGWDKPATKEEKQPDNGENGPSEQKALQKEVPKIKSRAEETKKSLKY